MSENKALDILKNAILLEKRGRSFYLKAAEQTENKAVKDFFGMMAEEEENHIKMLSDQYISYQKSGRFIALDYQDAGERDMASEILNSELKEKISSAGFESAAISAAIAMEDRAVKLYADRAEETENAEEKRLYQWLSVWERGHLNMLMEMDKELVQKVWNDNQFWPF